MKQYLLGLLLVPTCFISCNSYKHGMANEPSQKSNLTFGVVKSKIIKGETNQNEILKIFGNPNIITKNKSNNEVWSYNKMSVENKQGSTDYWMGRKASQVASSNSFDLIIIFDDKDTVIDYSVNSTTF